MLTVGLLIGSLAIECAEAVDRARLVGSVEALQQVHSRVAGTGGFARAADLVEGELSRAGLPVERRPFVVKNSYDGDRTMVTESLSSFVGPSLGPRIVLIAHLDSRGAADPKAAAKTGWRWDRSPAPGADDNASGCAALLEVGRVLAKVELAVRVDLVFTGAEEMAEMGSDGFMKNLGADQLADDVAGVEIRAAIAVDMLLRPRPWGPSLRVYSDGRLGSAQIAEALVLAAWAVAPAVEIDHRVAPSFTYSDHGSFWAVGVPAVLLIEDDFHHERYHLPEDRFDRADTFYSPEQLDLATRALVAAVVLISSS